MQATALLSGREKRGKKLAFCGATCFFDLAVRVGILGAAALFTEGEQQIHLEISNSRARFSLPPELASAGLNRARASVYRRQTFAHFDLARFERFLLRFIEWFQAVWFDFNGFEFNVALSAASLM